MHNVRHGIQGRFEDIIIIVTTALAMAPTCDSKYNTNLATKCDATCDNIMYDATVYDTRRDKTGRPEGMS
eukprot:8322886-Pyramimonas_sp.AAC.1